MNNTVKISMQNITKYFPGIIANDNVNFEIYQGEIHSLLGENGAGKSTLMNILSGVYKPDKGEIFIQQTPVKFKSPKDAINYGIGMVHQHFMLIPPHTVTENIILGIKKHSFLLHLSEEEKKIEEISKKYKLLVNPKSKIWQLSVGEKQRVEIIKMLYRGVDILIMDEPTAVLTPQESKELIQVLKEFTLLGKSVIFISHKLEEVMEVSDRITVLRKGKYIATVNKNEVNEQELTKMMVGREVLLQFEKKNIEKKSKILDIIDVETFSDKGIKALKKINFSVYGGEILGIAGVSGNGQQELAEVITGLRKVSSGKILINNKDMTNKSPLEIIKQGVSYIPGDRIGWGLVPNMSIIDNLMLKKYHFKEFYNGIFFNRKKINEYCNKLIDEYKISVSKKNSPVKLLSGGNLQKVILAREISTNPNLMIAVNPIRGLDIGATEFVYNNILLLREKGVAILLISEDLKEIFSLSDRIAVIYEGNIIKIVDRKDADFNTIGLMMSGKYS